MMMRVKETARIGFTSLLLSAALLIASGFAIGVVGQETQPQKPAATKNQLALVATRFENMSRHRQ